MKTLMACLFLLAAAPANAGLIATTGGSAGGGYCTGCSNPGFDIFEFGAEMRDLTGTDFSIQFNISDELLATQPIIGAPGFAFHYESYLPGAMTASVTINDHTYDLPVGSYYSRFGFTPDGRAVISLGDIYPVQGDGPRLHSLFAVANRDAEFMIEDANLGTLALLFAMIGDIVISPAPTSVPEPGSLALLAIGVIMMLAVRSRKRRSNAVCS